MNTFRPARIDRIGSAVLTLGLLTGSTWAIGTEWFASAPAPALRTARPEPRVLMLEPVLVVAARTAPHMPIDTQVAAQQAPLLPATQLQ